MKQLVQDKCIGDKIFYFGSRDVVLSGVITEILENSYIVIDSTTRLKHRIFSGELLDPKS